MRYVIIGNGAAGNAAATAIRERDPAGEVLIFSDESQPAYYRPLIVNLIDEDINKDIFFPPSGNEVATGRKIVALDAGSKQITLQEGKSYSYDRLLLATGAAAIMPEIPGLPGPGAFVLRNLADAQALAQAAGGVQKALVIGAGRVGLKAAMALHHAALEVTIVEQGPGPAPMQFDREAGGILAQALNAQGIRLLCGQMLTAVNRTGDRISGAALAGGRILEAGLIVAAVGVVPNVDLARQAVKVNQGIVVDRQLRTSAPDIYAAGDVTETVDLITGESLVSGLWTNAVEMGRLSGRNMAGAAQEYPGAWGVFNALEVAGVPTVAIGLTVPPPSDGFQVYQRRRGNNYRKLVCRDEVLVGALLVGDLEGAGVYSGLIRGRVRISNPLSCLDHPGRSLAFRLSGTISRAKRVGSM